ncbi:uncharacterized protein METZ01_LOCUS139176 [marine metagenome]|uniref:Uncharacterized protein n=1 Tax=marine metagenome TaxID=408172 RepID=A0A381ZBU0_9ZZZZ
MRIYSISSPARHYFPKAVVYGSDFSELRWKVRSRYIGS